MIKNFLNTLVVSFTFAMLQIDPDKISYNEAAPIVYKLDTLPDYGRQRPLIKRVKMRDLDLL